MLQVTVVERNKINRTRNSARIVLHFFQFVIDGQRRMVTESLVLVDFG